MDDAQARRQRRLQSLSIAKFQLGDEPSDDLSDTTTAQERLAMMWPLALRAWSLTGRPFPDYRRSTIPAPIIRAKP